MAARSIIGIRDPVNECKLTVIGRFSPTMTDRKYSGPSVMDRKDLSINDGR